jgi:PAS domain S-box-containing protein
MSTATAEHSILIVDDEEDIVLTLRDLLEHEGYQVDFAGTCAEAVARAAERHYNAVLLDLTLPDGDGLTVLKALQERDPTLPVIVLTADVSTDRRVVLRTRGAFDYLTKPYNRDDLRATLRKAVGVKALAVKAARVEHALTESQERFRSLVESATDAIVVADHRGRIVSWNRAASTLFGYAEAEVLGRPLTDLMPARYRDAHQKGLQRLRAGGEARLIGKVVELEGLRKDGSEFPLELSLATWQTQTETFFSGIIRDISERKQVQATLAASEERFRSLISNIPGAVYRCACDPHWTMEFLSDEIQDLCGYPASEFLGNRVRSYASVIHPDDRAMVERQVHEAVAQRRPYVIEYRLLHSDGDVRWVYEKGRGVFEDGRVRWLDGVIVDMTEHKRIEAALRESEERFHQLAEQIREVFWLSDPEKNHIYYVSPGYEQIWGRSCDSLYVSPRAWLDAIHPDDRPRVLQAALTKQVGGEYDEEYRIIRPDGSERWIRDRAFPVHDATGRVFRIAGLAEDITERKRAEEARRASEERLRLALRAADLGVWDWDLRSGRVYWSETIEGFFGLPSGSFPGTHAAYLDLIYLEDRGSVLQAVQNAIEGRAAFEIEHRVVRPDGTLHWLAWSGQVMKDPDGTAVRMLGTVRDVTAIKRIM